MLGHKDTQIFNRLCTALLHSSHQPPVASPDGETCEARPRHIQQVLTPRGLAQSGGSGHTRGQGARTPSQLLHDTIRIKQGTSDGLKRGILQKHFK